ncbi:MAG TPA: hypothetical protein VK472_08080 [Allosphingosinicella sp.]|nr:hypothetical protein [Allosphingosinicella sp.]
MPRKIILRPTFTDTGEEVYVEVDDSAGEDSTGFGSAPSDAFSIGSESDPAAGMTHDNVSALPLGAAIPDIIF